jgi:hypothetical protein
MSSPRPVRPPDSRSWAVRFIRNVLLWLIPVWAVWTLLTPGYNRFLMAASGRIVRLTESPGVTDILAHPQSRHAAYMSRRDFPPARRLVHQIWVTDVHFHLVLLGALFLALPGISWRERLANLGQAALITVFFDLLVLFFIVKAFYATGLGPWSLAHYGPFARNFYGIARHLLDLPFKLALPLLLWAGFYLREVPGFSSKTSLAPSE